MTYVSKDRNLEKKNRKMDYFFARLNLGRIWDLIVSVPDHCLSFYFDMN